MAYQSHAVSVARPSARGPWDDRMRMMLTDYYRFIFRVMRRLGVAEADVEDSTQQVFIVASNRIDQIEAGKEKPFLFATAARIAANVRRFQRHHPRSKEACTEQSSLSEQPDPEELLESKRIRQLLDAALDDLPMDLRTVFVLHELEELSSPEIAELTGLALGTVASRLRRARVCFEESAERLRSCLSDGGGA